MKQPLRILVWVTIATGIAGAVAFVLRPAPVEVDAGRVTRGPLLITIEEEGRTRVRERYVVSTPANGVLDRVNVRPGDRVSRGATIATLRPGLSTPLDARSTTQLRARAEAARDELVRAQAARDAARAELDFATADARRATGLCEAGALSIADRDLADTRMRTAQQRLQQASAAIRVTEHGVQEAEAALLSPRDAPRGTAMALRAPLEATVLRVFEESERTLPAGAPVVELGDPASLEIVVDLLSSDAVKVRPGAATRLHRWGGNTTLDGTVRRVEPSTFTKISALGVEEQRVNVVVDFDCGDEAALGDGYTVDVQIVVDSRANALQVPTGALVRVGEGWAVYVIDESSIARLRPITIGARAAFEVECLAGLAGGEHLVLYPGDRVFDGTRVRASSTSALR
jgi:HlyD family secretion protein